MLLSMIEINIFIIFITFVLKILKEIIFYTFYIRAYGYLGHRHLPVSLSH